MHNTTPSNSLYIDKVKNLYVGNKKVPDNIASIHIKEVEHLYICKAEPAITAASYNEHPTPPPEPSTISTLNHSQVVLATYYVLVSWGIRPRANMDLASIARFIHLLTGKPYKSIHSSDFYNKLQRAPNFKTDKGLIRDLEVIQTLFLQLELKEASLLIDKELTLIRQVINKP